MLLFDKLFGKIIDRRIAAYQSDLIEKHCQEVQNIYKTMRGWRHDYHNHIQAMLALTEKPDQIREYLLKLNADLAQVDTVIKTGNVMVDAILNSKISLIGSYNITVTAKAAVPPEISVSEIDLCVLIGNFLDNALEACLKQPENANRFIRIYVGLLKEQLYIYVANSTDGMTKKLGGIYRSTKNSPSHGFGIMRIDSIVEKYGGRLNRQHDEGIFATEAVLPL
ncbi:MAG: GHKL domain-containing protein [Ruminococcaceae bacterium]|nr:GHKL domain-containing protein [Oscillospiraceae bacterium]